MSAYWICDRCNVIEPMTFHEPRIGAISSYNISPQTPERWLAVPPRNPAEERRHPDRNVLCPTCAADYEDFMAPRQVS